MPDDNSVKTPESANIPAAPPSAPQPPTGEAANPLPVAPLPPSISGPGEKRTPSSSSAEELNPPAAGGPGSVIPGPPQADNELTSAVSMPSAPPQDLSIKDMFMNADAVVQSVMVLLLLASVVTWVVIFEKAFILRRASREVMLFKRAAAGSENEIKPDFYPDITRPMVKAGLRESGDSAGNESRSDYRERVERSMRAELSGLVDRLGCRSLFLATVGSISPFVGLFGTVWGIMNSFIGIAASGETTLAVVAPGIAEALFATAMGLVAAIPAVIAYNKITGSLKKITKEALSGIGFLGNRLAGIHYNSMGKAV